ncbi:hypothetical protein C8J56DRAFT_1043609 [Mycena floridula]|nr:hypothetical protein C8J56DRAFT_1043609 [Mycena floridula]
MSNRNIRQTIAESTLKQIDLGTYSVNGTSVDLKPSLAYLKDNTMYYPEESHELNGWSMPRESIAARESPTKITIAEISTLQGVRQLGAAKSSSSSRIAVLNFASAKHEGGGFLTGAQAQEESLARSSTLYPSLMTSTAQQFYTGHKRDPKAGFYSHSMIYSPRVTIFRDDEGQYEEPIEVDIVVSAAVNAGVARRKPDSEAAIEAAMKERMARILFLCEIRGARDLVLGSFGTGVFKNSVPTVARLWKELLVGEGARFKDSFDNVFFAVLGKDTYPFFVTVFENPG